MEYKSRRIEMRQLERDARRWRQMMSIIENIFFYCKIAMVNIFLLIFLNIVL